MTTETLFSDMQLNYYFSYQRAFCSFVLCTKAGELECVLNCSIELSHIGISTWNCFRPLLVVDCRYQMCRGHLWNLSVRFSFRRHTFFQTECKISFDGMCVLWIWSYLTETSARATAAVSNHRSESEAVGTPEAPGRLLERFIVRQQTKQTLRRNRWTLSRFWCCWHRILSHYITLAVFSFPAQLPMTSPHRDAISLCFTRSCLMYSHLSFNQLLNDCFNILYDYIWAYVSH